MQNRKFCPHCEALHDVSARRFSETISGYKVEVERFSCNVCGNDIFDEHRDGLLLEALLAEHVTDVECACCGSRRVETIYTEDHIIYGVKNPVVLMCVIPRRECTDCSCQFLDSEAEDIHEKIVQRHLASVFTSAFNSAIHNCSSTIEEQWDSKLHLSVKLKKC